MRVKLMRRSINGPAFNSIAFKKRKFIATEPPELQGARKMVKKRFKRKVTMMSTTLRLADNVGAFHKFKGGK